jgi:hypothetical protein
MPASEGFEGFVWIGDPFEGFGIGVAIVEEVVDAGPGPCGNSKAIRKQGHPWWKSRSDETNRGCGPAKGEDNRRWSWSSPLKTLALIDSSNGNRV